MQSCVKFGKIRANYLKIYNVKKLPVVFLMKKNLLAIFCHKILKVSVWNLKTYAFRDFLGTFLAI